MSIGASLRTRFDFVVVRTSSKQRSLALASSEGADLEYVAVERRLGGSCGHGEHVFDSVTVEPHLGGSSFQQCYN